MFKVYLVRMGSIMFIEGMEPVTLTNSISKAWKTDEFEKAKRIAECFGGKVICYEIKECSIDQ